MEKEKHQNDQPVENPQNWLFSFGYGHAHPNKYIKIFGTCFSAREEMLNKYENEWCFQYPGSKEQELKRHFMTELKE